MGIQRLTAVAVLLFLSVALIATPKVSFANKWMATATAVPPPLGFVRFCAQNMQICRVKYKDRVKMELSSHRWQQLSAVQTDVNQAITAQEDTANNGEHWSYAENGYGDCEDYALRKKKALIEKGWAHESLLLTTATTEKGEKHVVLTVVTDKGDYILDNRYATPQKWDALAYNWLSRQDPLNPLIWRKASGGMDMQMASLRR